MSALRHYNVVALFASYNSAKHVDLVMELVEGGELFDAIIERGSFNETEAQYVMAQLIAGIGYVHAMKIAHRDLKAENILIASKREQREVEIEKQVFVLLPSVCAECFVICSFAFSVSM